MQAIRLSLILTFLALVPFQIHADSWREETRKAFFLMAAKPDTAKTRIQLVTVSPGLTVTTAFGHAALRVTHGADYGPDDYYVDFGEYDASFSFLWRFLRGHARFSVNVLPMQSAFEAWDASGRGMVVSDLALTDAEKKKLIEKMVAMVRENDTGYEYHNFKSNCVTFMRDMIGHAKGQDVVLPAAALKDKDTWRKRVLGYSDQNVWLRIHEKLLFDYTTDVLRNGRELIFLPDDLLLALESMGWAGKSTEVLKDRMYHPPKERDIFGTLGILLMAVLIACMLPVPALERFQSKAVKTFAVMSGLGGLLSFMVFAVTTFDFMSHNITWLAFFPLDFALLKFKKEDPRWFHYGAVRLGMALLAAILMFTVLPQTVGKIVTVSVLFFALFTFQAWQRRQEAK